MIDPRIEMVDLEPDGFGVVSQMLSAHLRTPPPELHVMHRDGAIVRAVHTSEGVLEDLRGSAVEPAHVLRERHGVDRVVLVDERALGALAPALAAAGAAPTQDEMFVRSHRAFFGGPGVVADPPVRAGRWDRWAHHLRALGDDYVALAAGFDGDKCAFTVVATIVGGNAQRVTSLTPVLGAERPPASGAASLVEAAGRIGPVRLAVCAHLDAFADALRARTLQPLRDRALVCFGLPEDEP